MLRALLALCLMPPATLAQPPSFDALRAEVETALAERRPVLVDAWWSRLDATPLIEADTAAVFLWRGEAETVGVLGDLSAWAETLPLTRLDGTDLWYRRETLPPDARIEYLFMVDTASEGFGAELEGTLDPRNPHRVLSGFGPFSELAMPGYAYPAVFDPVRDGTPSTFDGLDVHLITAGVLPYEHEILVYTPPGYDDTNGAAYPTIYFLDGRDYVAFAHVPLVLDHLVETGQIEPIIAVFIDPPNRHGAEAPNRTTEYGLNDDFVTFVADEVIPFVGACYRTDTVPARRLIVGDSYGGLMALYLALSRPGAFGNAYSQSGYHSFRDAAVFEAVPEQPPAVRLWLDVGHYESVVGAGMLPAAETDFLDVNRRMAARLNALGYDLEYREYAEGHTWGNWRAHLLDALPYFFPPTL